MEANCFEVLPVLDQIYEVQVQHNKFIILLKMFDLNKIHPEVIQKFLEVLILYIDKLSKKSTEADCTYVMYLSLSPFSMNSSSYVISVSRITGH